MEPPVPLALYSVLQTFHDHHSHSAHLAPLLVGRRPPLSAFIILPSWRLIAPYTNTTIDLPWLLLAPAEAQLPPHSLGISRVPTPLAPLYF